jgi:CubicO group peptidase (beta-lactamase class C family)
LVPGWIPLLSTIGEVMLAHRIVARSIVALAVPLVACARGSAGTSDAPAVAAATSATDSARMARVLAGLRGGLELSDRTPARWTLAERMANHRVPGVSIAVIDGGRVAWARGFGVKDAGGADPVTPATLFQAASISKPVSATAMLRLVERGTLDLDTDVNRYLTSWKVPENRFTATEKVTLRRIASHTAGLTVHGFPGYATTDSVPTAVQVLNGAKPANTRPVVVDTFPGAIWRYSGGGTTVMQQLLVDVTGKPFPTLMRELVLGPAGMTRSTFEQPLPASRVGEASHAHDRRGAVIPGSWHVYPEMAPAGLWTTPTDLAKWALAIADARAGRSSALLRQETARQMLTEIRDGYGIGPGLGGSGTSFSFGHGGANEGFHSELRYYPELGVGAAVMTNGDGGPLLIREVMYAIAAEYGWPDRKPQLVETIALDSAKAAGILGSWTLRVGQGVPGTITREDGKLMFRAPQLPDEELVPVSESSFVMVPLGWRMAFERDATGRATSFRVTRPQGPPVEGSRQP